MNSLRVLIIDDGKAGEELAHHMKMMYGAETFRATKRSEGLKMAAETQGLDAIIVDLSLPDSSREQSVDRLRDFVGQGPLVYVFTGYADKDLFEKSLMNGAEDWFLKGPYRDEHGNDRGSSALAKRVFVDWKKRNGFNGITSRYNASAVMDARTVATQNPRVSWFSTAHAVITLGVLLILQLIALCWFIYSQGGSNALFRNRVEMNTSAIAKIEPQLGNLHDSVNFSKQNQQKIETDIQVLSARVTKSDDRFDELRKDMNAGFQRIYDILLADRKTNSDNRQTDQQAQQRK